MHIDPERLAKAIRHLAESSGIKSDVGRLLFSLECLLTLILLIVVGFFLVHDLIIMVFFPGRAGEAMEALKSCLVVFVISFFCVVVREYLMRPGDR